MPRCANSGAWRGASTTRIGRRVSSSELSSYFQLAQVLGLSPDAIYRLTKPEWAILVREIESFSGLERRRIFHLAYERRFCTQTLDAIALHARRPTSRPESPRFQAVFCIDEREESFRRHLEELAPDVETFGVAGFYAVAIYYKGAADAHFTPLCPVVIRPGIWVTEEVQTELGQAHRRRAQTRRVLGTVSLRIHEGSRGFALGAVLTGALGVLASFPLLARILFPRLTAQIRHRFGRLVQTPPLTRLRIERTQPSPGPTDAAIGFSVAEMIDAAERLLRDIGLTRGFARLLLLARPRLAQPEQSARLGPQLRGLRRRLGRAERTHHGPDLERPEGARGPGPARVVGASRDGGCRRLSQYVRRLGDLLRPRPNSRVAPP